MATKSSTWETVRLLAPRERARLSAGRAHGCSGHTPVTRRLTIRFECPGTSGGRREVLTRLLGYSPDAPGHHDHRCRQLPVEESDVVGDLHPIDRGGRSPTCPSRSAWHCVFRRHGRGLALARTRTVPRHIQLNGDNEVSGTSADSEVSDTSTEHPDEAPRERESREPPPSLVGAAPLEEAWGNRASRHLGRLPTGRRGCDAEGRFGRPPRGAWRRGEAS